MDLFKQVDPNWKKFKSAVKHLRVIYLYGPPGIGKSYSSMEELTQIAPPFRVTLNEDTMAQELMGSYFPAGDRFEWRDAPFTAALRKGTLVIDELDRGSAAVQDLGLAVMDSEGSSAITLPTNEVVKAHDKFKVVLTSNRSPDEANISSALMDRIDAVIHVSTPSEIAVKVLNEKMNGLGTLVLDSYGDKTRAVSIRKALAFHQLVTGGIKDKNAAEIVFDGRAEDILMLLKTVRDGGGNDEEN